MDTRFFSFREGSRPFHFCKRFYNSVRDGPPQKVELGTGGRETLELDTRGPTKRIKELFTVPVQTRFVGDVYRKKFASGRRQRHVVVLGIVGHEPFELSKGRALALDNVMKLFAVVCNLEKLDETS